jgi:hypothetical protein
MLKRENIGPHRVGSGPDNHEDYLLGHFSAKVVEKSNAHYTISSMTFPCNSVRRSSRPRCK